MLATQPAAFWLVVFLLVSGKDEDWSAERILQPSYNESDNPCHKTKTVNLLVMAPFPDPTGLDPGRDTGPIVIPASIVAASSINARCDMLGDYRIQLLVVDSGCNINTRAISSLVNITLDPDYQVVGIIGPSCSEAAIEVGAFLARPEVSLLNISPSATSLKLLNQSKYPNTFRILSSSREFVTMYLALINELQIKNIAIFFEHVSSVQASAANDFHQQILSSFEDVSVTVLGMSGFFIPLEQIRNRFRLVFVFGGQDISRKLLCLAFHRNMIYPDYQYFFSEIILHDLLRTDVSVSVNGVTLECTGMTGDMSTATVGIILSLFLLIRFDTDTSLVDDNTAGDFYYDYYEQQSQYSGFSNRVVEINDHQTGYHDSVWAYALALNASMPRIESEFGVSLANYTYGHPNITKVIRTELLKVRFEGTRGTIDFSERTLDGENVTHMRLIIVRDSVFQQQIIGEFDPTLLQEERISIDVPSAIVADSFDQVILAPPIYVEVVVLLTVAMMAITVVVFHVVNLKWTAKLSIKVTSPFLNNLIFFGCYLYLLSILFVSLNQAVGNRNHVVYATMCGGFFWCESLAFSLIFGTICVKSWRILCIFSRSSSLVYVRGRKRNSQRKGRSKPFHLNHLDTHFLVIYVCILVIIDVAFQISWNIVDPWFMKTNAKMDGHQIYLSCDSGHLSAWVSSLICQKAVLTILVLYMSIATRNIPREEYKQTKSTNALVYGYILINGVFASIYLFLLKFDGTVLVLTFSYLAICLKNIFCVVMCTILVFLPPVLPILQEKWKAMKL